MILKDNGVTINGKHSYRDLGLILTSKFISKPEPQTKMIEVPGRNGLIDLSEVLTGNVRYKPRTVEMNFHVLADPEEWAGVISNIQNLLDGQKARIIFDDDEAFYWSGRPVFEFSNNGKVGTLKVSAEVDPYKYSIVTSAEDWLWDPFDFEYGIINETANIVVSGTVTVTIEALQRWENPIIISDSAMTVTFNGETYDVKQGSQVMYDIIITAGTNTLTFNGNGTVTVVYVGGML